MADTVLLDAADDAAAAEAAKAAGAVTPPAKTAEELAAEAAAQTPEQKAAAEAAAAKKVTDDAAAAKKVADDAAAEAAKNAVPEKYAAFTLPEGVKIEGTQLDAFHAVAKDLKLSQEGAQKLVTLQAEAAAKAGKAAQEHWDGIVKGWVDAGKTDKEFGGAKYDENVGLARKALAKLGTPELNKALRETDMANHPEVVRFLYRVAKATGEDKLLTGGAGQAPKDIAAAFYPSMVKQ